MGKFFLGTAVFLVLFNVWHNTTRRIWNLSVRDSLTMGENVIGLAEKTDPAIRVSKAYDGQFYYAVAHDPLLLTKEALPYVDLPLYRYRRVLLPLLAHAVSLGKPFYLPFALFFINVAGWLLSGVAAYRIVKRWDGWAGLAAFGVLITTGLTFAAFRTLSEPLAMALVLWGCLQWMEKKKLAAAVLFSLAGLARETALLTPLALAAHDWWFDKKSWKEQAWFLFVSFTPGLLWTAYLSARLGPGVDIPLGQHLAFPYAGFVKDMALASRTLTTSTEKIRCFSIAAMVVLLSAVVYASFWKKKTFFGALAISEALFCSLVYGEIWSYHASACRVAAPLMVFSLLWFLEAAKKISAPAILHD